MARPKRVLYVEGNTDGTIGGSFFSLLFLIKNLDRLRYVPTVVFSAPNALIPEFTAAGAEVCVVGPATPVRWRHAPLRPLTRAINLGIGAVIEPLRLARLIRKRQIDLVHLNNSIERNHSWIVASVLAGVPRITHERGINPKLSRPARLLVSRLDGIICISQAVRQNLERLGLGSRNLTTVWNALEPSEMRVCRTREAVLAEFGLAATTRLIGIVGNIRRWKGQLLVVDALDAVVRAYPDVACLLIGHYTDGDLSYKREVERAINERKLQQHVIVTGYRANVADYIAALDVLIHASVLPEPFGRVLLEGMALRKPLVASGDGAVPEIVEDGVTGLLFRPGDANDLADKLLRLLRSPETGRAMGQAGYERLKSRFAIEQNVRATMALYEQILS